MTTPLTPPAPSTPRGEELLHLDALDNGYQEVAEYLAYGLFRSCVEAYLKHATRPAQAALSEEEAVRIIAEAIHDNFTDATKTRFQKTGYPTIGLEHGEKLDCGELALAAYRALTAAQNRGGR